MNAVVIDTDVVSFLFKGDSRADNYRRHVQGRTAIVSFMTRAELYRWALWRDWGADRRRRLDMYLRRFVTHPYSDSLCRVWAAVSVGAQRSGRPIGTADAWVAAVAVLHRVPLVTHNYSHYRGVPGLLVAGQASPE